MLLVFFSNCNLTLQLLENMSNKTMLFENCEDFVEQSGFSKQKDSDCFMHDEESQCLNTKRFTSSSVNSLCNVTISSA